MNNKASSTVVGIIAIIVFWFIFYMILSWLGNNVVSDTEFETITGIDRTLTDSYTSATKLYTNFKFITKLMFFQIEGVNFFVSLIMDLITIIGVVLTLSFVRGLN